MNLHLALSLNCFLQLPFYFAVIIEHSVNTPTCPDREIIYVRQPLVSIASLRIPTRRKVTVNDVREVFRPVDGPEGQADRQKLPAPSDDG